MLGGRFGRYLLAAGAVGELFPIFAIAVFLGASNKFVALASLVAVGLRGAELRAAAGAGQPAGADPPGGRGLHRPDDHPLDRRAAAAAAADRRGVRPRRGPRRSWPGSCCAAGRRATPTPWTTSSTPSATASSSRCSSWPGDVAGHPLHRRGAAAAACVLRPAAGGPGGAGPVPVPRRAAAGPAGPVDVPDRDRPALLVALAEIGLRNGTMLPENAAALVGAGALSVLVFPMAAVLIERRRRAGEARRPRRPPGRRPRRTDRSRQPPTISAASP